MFLNMRILIEVLFLAFAFNCCGGNHKPKQFDFFGNH